MNHHSITRMLAAMFCLLLAITAAQAETRQSVIWLEGMEETFEETLLETPHFSCWYANDQLRAERFSQNGLEYALVLNAYADDYMLLQPIPEEEAFAYAGEIYSSVLAQHDHARVQMDLYREADEARYTFITLIARNGQFLLASGAYSVEAAEGIGRYFEHVLDSVEFGE